jgi:hypothetical protein
MQYAYCAVNASLHFTYLRLYTVKFKLTNAAAYNNKQTNFMLIVMNVKFTDLYITKT